MEQKLRAIFAESLALDPALVVDSLAYGETPAWDSVAHMALVAAIEQGFDIMLDAQDVIDLSSFGAAKAIVARYV